MEETKAVKPSDSGSLVAQRANLLPQSLEQVFAFGEMMSRSGCVPQHLANKDACSAVALQALQWGLNPFAVAQKTYMITKGKLSYEAQLIMAVINVSGALNSALKFQWNGEWEKVQGKVIQKESARTDDNGEKKKYYIPAWKPEDEKGLSCTVTASLKKDGEEHSLTVELTQATIRNSTLWASDPRQQLAYLTVKRWASLYCPEVILGFVTDEDVYEERQPIDGGEVIPEPVKQTMLAIGEDIEDGEPEPVEPETVEMPTEEEKKEMRGSIKATGNHFKTIEELTDFVKTALGFTSEDSFTLDTLTKAQCLEVTEFYKAQA